VAGIISVAIYASALTFVMLEEVETFYQDFKCWHGCTHMATEIIPTALTFAILEEM
jgi:hypothetical protein